MAILLNAFRDRDSQTETHFLTQFYYIVAWFGSDDLTTLSWRFLCQKTLISYYNKIVNVSKLVSKHEIYFDMKHWR